MKKMLLCLAMALCLVTNIAMADTPAADPENTLYLDLKDGRVVIQLRPDLAPNHVARIKELTKMGFYDGSKFHRVIAGFMAQTGDPTGTGRGGSGTNIKAEFSGEPFERGTVGMARGPNSNDSADSQFFICFAQASSLNGQYTVFGKVTSGMEFVDKIKKGDPNDNGSVTEPDTVVKMQLAADADKPKAPDAAAPAPAPAPDAAKAPAPAPAPAPEATPPAKP
ncbi:MAG: peptidylprolyl isomerase [Alphaproteobacteria bacterium]|nr:MAG: peptidylprolyl isomerase [Alphaproteobacteria bacterium]